MAVYGEMRLGWDRDRADRHARTFWEPNRTWQQLDRRLPGALSSEVSREKFADGRGRADHRSVGPSLDLAIQQFLDHLRVERELTPATVEAYGRDLSRFAHFAAGRTVATADAVRSIDILDFLVHLTEKKMAARSQARRLIALRQFFKFLKAEKHRARRSDRGRRPPALRPQAARLPDGRRDRQSDGGARSAHDARAARRGDAGGALRDRPARLRAGQDAAARRQLRRRLPDHLRQGPQGTAGPGRRGGARVGARVRRGDAARPCCTARRWTRCSSRTTAGR